MIRLNLTYSLGLSLLLLVGCNNNNGTDQETLDSETAAEAELADGDLNMNQDGEMVDPATQSVNELLEDTPEEILEGAEEEAKEEVEKDLEKKLEEELEKELEEELKKDEEGGDSEQDEEEQPPVPLKLHRWMNVDAAFQEAVDLGDIDLSYCKLEVEEFDGCSRLENRANRQASRYQKKCERQALIAYRAENIDKQLRVAEIQSRLESGEILEGTARHDRVSARLLAKKGRIASRLDNRINKIQLRMDKIEQRKSETIRRAAVKQCVILEDAQDGDCWTSWIAVEADEQQGHFASGLEVAEGNARQSASGFGGS